MSNNDTPKEFNLLWLTYEQLVSINAKQHEPLDTNPLAKDMGNNISSLCNTSAPNIQYLLKKITLQKQISTQNWPLSALIGLRDIANEEVKPTFLLIDEFLLYCEENNINIPFNEIDAETNPASILNLIREVEEGINPEGIFTGKEGPAIRETRLFLEKAGLIEAQNSYLEGRRSRNKER